MDIKPCPVANEGEGPVLVRTLEGIYDEDGPWYVLTHELLDRGTGTRASLGRTDSVDWDGGDLVFARDGRLYRLAAPFAHRLAIDEARELLDLRTMRFQEKAPPASALRW